MRTFGISENRRLVVDNSENARWRCLYCGQPIAEADRRAASKVLELGGHGRRVGRAHLACKLKRVREALEARERA